MPPAGGTQLRTLTYLSNLLCATLALPGTWTQLPGTFLAVSLSYGGHLWGCSAPAAARTCGATSEPACLPACLPAWGAALARIRHAGA